jgi:hypothetical protein
MSFKILMAALVIVTVLTAAGITILARRAEAVEGSLPGADPGKAYLGPQRPISSEVHIIDFDPAAQWPR